jgi:hypothetical protein
MGVLPLSALLQIRGIRPPDPGSHPLLQEFGRDTLLATAT